MVALKLIYLHERRKSELTSFQLRKVEMTRFARAKGSKSSNERHPEEATPWHEMKQQMQKKQRHRQESSTAAGSRKHMIFTESEVSSSTWAEFEDGKIEKKVKPSKIRHSNVLGGSPMVNDSEDNHAKKKDKLHQIANESKAVKKLSKRKRERLEINDMIKSSIIAEKNAEYQEIVEPEKSEQLATKGLNSETDNSKASNSNDITPTNNKNKAFIREAEQKVKIKNKPMFEKRKIKGAKEKGGKDNKRRKPEDSSSMTMFINGKEIEVVKYDGFPVKKEDAVRLTELRTKLKAKGIPHESIVMTMKLERRRAEKALARERKKVCFHCRKSGHVLSDCPELNETAENEAGICFKCGSTEHTHFQCKVSRGDDYRYASCFICKEQGHIARQCPDNPRGLYPKGGACKVCGAVTHLKKDCPDLIKEKEQQIITLKPLNNNSVEAIDDDLNTTELSKVAKKSKRNKTVKF